MAHSSIDCCVNKQNLILLSQGQTNHQPNHPTPYDGVDPHCSEVWIYTPARSVWIYTSTWVLLHFGIPPNRMDRQATAKKIAPKLVPVATDTAIDASLIPSKVL